MAVSTDEIMRLALELAGMREVPADSAVYHPGDGIRRLLAGIDVGVPELLLARQLGADGVLAHHPAGLVGFYQVLDRHVDLMVAHGVPPEEARRAAAGLIERTRWRNHAANHDHAASAARLLDLPFLNVHLPCDEIGRRLMQGAVDAAVGPDARVRHVVEALYDAFEEFRRAPTRIEVAAGHPDAPAGRVVVVHGCGTNGGYAVADALFRHGVGTVVYIHVDPAELQRLRQDGRGNLVVTGHIASDALGMRPLLEAIARRGVDIVGFSGLG